MLHLNIFYLLPKTDCRMCGHEICLVFAMRLAQDKSSIESCPAASREAVKVIQNIILADRGAFSSLRKAMTEVKHGSIKSALLLLHDVFFKFPGRAVNFLFITFPLSIPITLVIIWLCIC